MSNFVNLNENNEIVNSIVINDLFIKFDQIDYLESEKLGQKYIKDELGLDGLWKITSFNGFFRKQYASIGYTYDPYNDIFICPQPYPSWILNENFDWIAPTPMPNDGNTYVWNEDQLSWQTI